jgi:lipopolysaccharide/colanic/teichoic acid biosynthesis glycosyltransferase
MLVKRIFDVCGALFGLVILLPLLLIIAAFVKFSSRGGIFFRQQRVGLNGNSFYLHKFRTMVTNAENLGLKITTGDDWRITTVGKFLRKTKLDELPQLFDVLIGKMSLVGPRPEVPEYVKLYPPEIQDIVLSVKPGITDWASIKLINENDILAKSTNPEDTYINVILPKKLALAVDYVKRRSLWVDIGIIWATIVRICKL